MAMQCPYCRAMVEPTRDAAGGLWCPACGNTGQVRAPMAPVAGGAQPMLGALPPQGPPAQAPSRATTALVLGILAIVIFPVGLILGIIAVVVALKAQRELRTLPPGTPGSGMATTGLVLGGIGILVGLVAATVILAAVVFVLVSNLGEAETWAFLIDDSGPGGVLTVDGYPGYPDWSEYYVDGTASCRLPSGSVDYGDEIVCTSDGTVFLVDATTNELLYEAEV